MFPRLTNGIIPGRRDQRQTGSILVNDIEIQSQFEPSVRDRCRTCQTFCEESIRMMCFAGRRAVCRFLLSQGWRWSQKAWARGVARVRDS